VRTWIFSLASVLAVSLVSLIGLATLSLGEARVRRMATVLVSFAVGALLGDAFIHLLPESFANAPHPLGASAFVLGGILLFFVIEKLLRHRHLLHTHRHPEERRLPELAAINVLGDAIHNFIDGVLIAASYLASPWLGVSTTIAVLFHEIPQELGDYGILVHSGVGVRRAVVLNMASAGCAVVGTVVTLVIGTTAGAALVTAMVPVTAGGFLYIALADLVPELQHDRGVRGLALQSSLISLGIAAMALLALLE
jgi:zinc and cadmium transporter